MTTLAKALALLVVILGLGAHARDRFDDWVDRTVMPPVLADVGIEVRARDGTLLRVFSVENGRKRLAVRLEEVDPDYLAMLVAYEDKRFYSHNGVDPAAVLRAAAQAVWHGKVVSGASTLTMQVARLLENSGTGNRTGKLRQMRLALALERRLTKEQILTLYLHHAPFGGPVEGIRAATYAWFGKEPARLTSAQAALLVALPQSPETRRPDRHPEVARRARGRVMARLGLPQSDRQTDVPDTLLAFAQDAPHLAARLKAQAPTTLKHRTTIDADLQRAMQRLSRRAIMGQASGVSAALIVADHTTGEILAHVGAPELTGVDGVQGFNDMTAAYRSPGSTLKPLVYGLAFDEGLAHPDTLVNDAPVHFGSYAPQNFDGQFRGMLTVRDALALSLNIPPVLLTHELGAARLMAGLRRAGAQPVLPEGQRAGLAVALGGVGLRLSDLVSLYAGIANGGASVKLRATDGGTADTRSVRIMSPVAAWQVSNILAGITPPRGSAGQAGEIAYKTGTSYGHRDAWAIGFDGQHVVGVWLGRPDGTPVPGAFGGDLAAPVLFEAFGRIAPQRVPLALPPSDTLIVGTAQLPDRLQVFKSRAAAFSSDPDRPVVTFPPDGAVLHSTGFGVPLKLRAGTLPITVLVNGLPVADRLRARNMMLPLDVAGYTRISVVDAQGRSDSVEIRLD